LLICGKKIPAALNKQINDLESFFRRSTNHSNQLRIMAAAESSFRYHFLKLKEIRIRKFSALKNHHQTTKIPEAIQGSEKSVINLSAQKKKKVRRWGLALSIGPNRVGCTWRRRQNPVSETLCFKKINRTVFR
jgi:hypothetical protein